MNFFTSYKRFFEAINLIIEFLTEVKSEDLDIREVLINIKFSNDRSFSEILTQIRAIKGVTVINIINPSRLVSGNPHDNGNKTYFATIKLKVEIKCLDVKNYIKYIHDNVKRIPSVISLQIKKKTVPKIDPRRAQEIKNILTI